MIHRQLGAGDRYLAQLADARAHQMVPCEARVEDAVSKVVV